MEHFEEEVAEPVSPIGQYFSSSVLNVYVLAVLEFETPINDLKALPLLQELFLPVNPRFSSIMIKDKKGKKQWKPVEVKLEEHINVPILSGSLPLESYDDYFERYMSRIAMEQLPQNRPLWEVHIFKYPTSNAAGTLIVKLHHALGDGYSLMGTLLSSLQRVDNPSLPLTFPSTRRVESKSNSRSVLRRLQWLFSWICSSISDFGWALLKSSVIEDDQTPIRSGDQDVRFRPITISNVSFSLDRLKEVKFKLEASINDVLVGLIFFGIRLYMQEINHLSSKAHSTALVLLNTRNTRAYKSVKEMVDTNAKTTWGNRFAFLHIPIPTLSDSNLSNPLEFVLEAQKIVKRKRYSLAVPLSGMLLDMVKKFKGPEAAARFVNRTLINSSATISNMIGPLEQMGLADYRVKGFYFISVGSPESLTMTMMSYMGNVRVAFGVEEGFIDALRFKKCMENSMEMMLTAARKLPSKFTRAISR